MADNEREKTGKLHIRLNLNTTPIAVNINSKDEAMFREAEKLINDTIRNYSSAYAGRREDKEIEYMAMLSIALKCVGETDRNDTAPLYDILSKITSEIEEALQ